MAEHDDLSRDEKQLDQILSNSNEEISKREKQISNLLNDKGPEPRPSGFGPSTVRPMGTKAQARTDLQAKIDSIKIDTDAQINKITEKYDPEKRKELTDASQARVERASKKDLSMSQEYASRLKLNSIRKQQTEPFKEKSQDKGEHGLQNSSKYNSYASGLRYNQIRQNKENEPVKSPGKEGRDKADD